MDTRVVCISGPDGAHMREVARGIADALGFRLVDEEIVQRAAAETEVDADVVADAERRRGFVERLLDGLGAHAEAPGLLLVGMEGFAIADPGVTDAALRDAIKTSIDEIAQEGGAVIVAHAASHALAARPDALRVLVTASDETRVARVAAERGISEKDASKAVDAADAARADYLKRFYGARAELPTQYDVVVNTDRLTPAEAVAVVKLAAGQG